MLSAGAFVFLPQKAAAAAPSCAAYALDFDGNIGDTDDVGALPVAVELLKVANVWNDKVVHLSYNSNIYSASGPATEQGPLIQAMRESVAAVGIADDPRVFDSSASEAEVNAAVANLAQHMQTGNLCLMVGGPWEVTYRALEQANCGSNVTIITHSEVNDERENGGSRNRADAEKLCPNVNVIRIFDQNKTAFNTNVSDWQKLADEKPIYQIFVDRTIDASKLEKSGVAKNGAAGDMSDAGMTYYALTGNDRPSVQEVLDFFLGEFVNNAPEKLADFNDQLQDALNNSLTEETPAAGVSIPASGGGVTEDTCVCPRQ